MVISKESIKYSLKNIRQRKARSFLTVLSIFVGIATIFIFISFGWGLYDYIEEFTSESSANKLVVQPKGLAAPGLDDTFQLTEDELDLVKKIDGVKKAQGIYIDIAEVKKDEERKYVFITGFNPEEDLLLEMSNINIEKGRALFKGEKAKVALGYNYLLDDKIFSRSIDINDRFDVQGDSVRVVGFYESAGNPQDDSNIYVTKEYMEELYPNISYAWIVAEVEEENIETIKEEIEDELRDKRGLEEGKEDFFVQSFKDLIESYSSALNVVIGFVILIALISVLVSAINTSNTMITSVLERVKEIGIIKAIGARNSEVFKIFLFESGFLGFIGGLIGVLLGLVLTEVGAFILSGLGWSFLMPHYSWQLFLGLIAFATLTGAISGVIPAYNASRTNPVDALRYE